MFQKNAKTSLKRKDCSEVGVTHRVQHERVPSPIYCKQVEKKTVLVREQCADPISSQEMKRLNDPTNYNEPIIRQSKINTE